MMLLSLFSAALADAQSLMSEAPSQMFISAPKLYTPVLLVNKSGGELANGLLLMTTPSQGPVLVTDSGDLVWNGPQGPSFNLFAQTLDNQPVLTYWTGSDVVGGLGYGQVNILDTTYT